MGFFKSKTRSPAKIIETAINGITGTERADVVDQLKHQVSGMIRMAQELGLISKQQQVALVRETSKAVKAALAGCAEFDDNNRRAEQHKETAARVERDWWVEQARMLQNQVQMWQQNYSSLLTQVQRSIADGPDTVDVHAALTEARAMLERPVVGVEAARALQAVAGGRVQGRYTSARLAEPDGDSLVIQQPVESSAKAKPARKRKAVASKRADGPSKANKVKSR